MKKKYSAHNLIGVTAAIVIATATTLSVYAIASTVPEVSYEITDECNVPFNSNEILSNIVSGYPDKDSMSISDIDSESYSIAGQMLENASTALIKSGTGISRRNSSNLLNSAIEVVEECFSSAPTVDWGSCPFSDILTQSCRTLTMPLSFQENVFTNRVRLIGFAGNADDANYIIVLDIETDDQRVTASAHNLGLESDYRSSRFTTAAAMKQAYTDCRSGLYHLHGHPWLAEDG